MIIFLLNKVSLCCWNFVIYRTIPKNILKMQLNQFLSDRHIYFIVFFCDLIHFLFWCKLPFSVLCSWTAFDFLLQVSSFRSLSKRWQKGHEGRHCNQKDDIIYFYMLIFFLCSHLNNSIFLSLISDKVLVISQWAVTKTIQRGFYNLCYHPNIKNATPNLVS